MDFGEFEGLEVRAGLPNRRLDVLFQELVHEDGKEWPGLLKNLRIFRRHCPDIIAAQSCPKNLIIANVFPVSFTAEECSLDQQLSENFKSFLKYMIEHYH